MSKRSLLLPPYLDSNSGWVDYVSAIDEVWYDKVDEPIRTLSKLRHIYILPEVVEFESVYDYKMLNSETQFEDIEKEILVKQISLLGLNLPNTDLFNNNDLQRIVRNLGKFWYGKGTFEFIDFVSYCINAELTMQNLWATSKQGVVYDQFVEEGDVALRDVVLQMYGGSGSTAFTADSAAYDPTTKIEFEWYGRLNTWNLGVRQSFISKWNGPTNNRQYIFRISATGQLEFILSTNGTNAFSFTSTIALQTLVTSGSKVGLKNEIIFDNGTGNSECRFYIKDGGSQWKLIDKILGTIIPGIFAGSSPLEIGTTNQGTVDNAVGITIRAKILVDGVLKADFEPGHENVGDTTFTDSLGNVWNIGAPAILINTVDFTPVWAGGVWFPSTHVRVGFDAIKFQGINVNALGDFFRSFANYNLVLKDITQEANFNVVQEATDKADIVALLGIDEHEHYIPDYNLSFATALQLQANGSYAAIDTVDSPENSVVGDLDIRIRVAPLSWTGGALQTLMIKEDTPPNKFALGFFITTDGKLRLYVSDTAGTIETFYESSIVVPFASNIPVWLKSTRVASSGLVTFSTSISGTTWQQLGTTGFTTAGNIYDSSNPISIGYRISNGSRQMLGKVFYAEIRNGLDGTRVMSMDPNDAIVSATTFQSKLTKEFWDLQGNAALV